MRFLSQIVYFIRTLFRLRWFILLPLLLIVGGTALYTYTRPVVYESSALVLIEKAGENSLANEGVKVERLQEDYYQTQYEILQSRSLADRVAKKLNIADNPEFAQSPDPVGALQSRIRIQPVRRSRLVKITAQSSNPAMAATMANVLANEFIAQNEEGRLFLAREVLRSLEKSGPVSVQSLPAVVNNPLIQELKTNLAKLRAQRAELSHRYKAVHPEMLQLNAQISETEDQLAKEMDYISKSVKLQLSRPLEGNNVRIVDMARAPRLPVSPRKRRNMAFGVLFGLWAGFGLAFIIARLDSTVRSREDLGKWVKIPFLGSVRKVAPSGHAYFRRTWTGPASHGAEAFRTLRAAVSVRLGKTPNSSAVMVTSSVQGEGKSFICANLARCFAQTGERVLLIDGDLRHPSQHGFFGVNTERGLNSYLADDIPPNHCVADTGIPNLKLMPGGNMLADPTELLNETRLRSLLHWARGDFDRIIVDSPPLLPVADALLWGAHVDGIVLVVRAHYVSGAAVQWSWQTLKESFPAATLGAILNQDVSSHANTYNYSRYGASISRRPQRPRLAERRPV